MGSDPSEEDVEAFLQIWEPVLVRRKRKEESTGINDPQALPSSNPLPPDLCLEKERG